MTQWFRNVFSTNRHLAPSEGGPFGSFYKLINETGGGFYRVLLIVSSIGLMIGLGLALLRFISAGSGRPKDEAKAKVTQLILIIFFMSFVTGFVGFIFELFHW